MTSSDGIVKDKSKIVAMETMKKFEKGSKTVKGGHLLNHMTKPLSDLFVTFKSAKIIWGKLDVKCEADDARKKKYVVSEWLHF